MIKLFKDKINEINIWHSKKNTISDWHYDSYFNLLCVIKGTKVVEMFPPNSKILKSESILTDCYNQASFTKKYIDNKVEAKVKFKLKKNEALFIPPGWFHRVSSKGKNGISALNFWFNSIDQNNIIEENSDFFLKYLLHKKLNQYCDYSIEYYVEINKVNFIFLLKNNIIFYIKKKIGKIQF